MQHLLVCVLKSLEQLVDNPRPQRGNLERERAKPNSNLIFSLGALAGIILNFLPLTLSDIGQRHRLSVPPCAFFSWDCSILAVINLVWTATTSIDAPVSATAITCSTTSLGAVGLARA